MAAATAFYAPIRAFQKGIQTIYQLDTAMTELRKVTNESAETYRQFALDANVAAQSLGKLTADVVNSASEWARLGYTINQSMTLAKESILYSMVGDIDVRDASKSLISTIKGFGIAVDAEGQNVRKVVDLFNEIGNNYAISSEGIGEALRRSAASLSAAGNSIEQSVALVTAANSVLQDPTQVGTALKTVSMRIRGISDEGEDLSDLVPKLEESFSKLGLTLKKNDNTFKNTYEIFDDLSKIWNKLSDFDQANITELVAGKRQGNIIAGMLKSWQDATDSLQSGLNSAGSAAREHEQIMNSIQGKVRQFQNEVVGFWQGAIDTQTIKDFVDTGTSFISLLTNIVNTFGLVPTVVGTATISILTFNKGLRTTIGTFAGGQLLKGLATAGLQIKALSIFTDAYTGSAKAARVATIGLQFALSAGIGVAIVGVTMLVQKLIGQYQEQKRIQHELQLQTQTITNSWINQKDKVQELIKQYSELSDATKNGAVFSDNEQEQKYKDVIEQLSNLMPNLVKSIDEKGDKHLKNADAIKEELIYAEKLSNLEQNQKILDAESGFKEQINNIKELRKNILEIEDKISSGGFVVNSGGYASFIEYSESQLNQFQMQLLTLQSQLATASSSIEDYFTTLTKIITKYSGLELTDSISKGIAEVSKSLSLGGLSSKELNDKAHLVAQLVSTMDNLILVQGKQLEDNDIYAKSSIVYRKAISDIAVALGISETKIEEIIETQRKQLEVQNDIHDSTNDLALLRSNVNKKYEESIKVLKSLNSALEDVSKGQSLSADTIADLILQYPQLASAVRKTADGWTIEKDALEAVQKAKLQLEITSLKTEVAVTNTVVKQLKERLKAYGIEISAIEDVASAWKAVYELSSTVHSEEDFSRMPLADQEVFKESRKQMEKLKSDTVKYGELLESISQLELLLGDVGKDTKKNSSSSSEPNALSEITFQSELIESFKSLYNARQQDIKLIDKQIAAANKKKEYAKVIELETKKINEQLLSINDLTSAQNKLAIESNRVRSANKNLNIDSFFDSGGNATQTYIDLMKQYETRSNGILNNSKLSNKQKDEAIKKLAKERDHIQDVFKEVQAYKKAWIDARDKIDEHRVAIEASKDSVNNLYKELKDKAGEWSDSVKSTAKDALGIIEDYYKEQERKAKESLDKQLDDFNKFVDDQVKAMDRLNETEDYNKELKKKQAEQQKIESQINTLSLDNSLEAQAKKKELEEQLAKQIEEIAEYQQDRERKQRKDNYDDLKDMKQKQVYEEKTKTEEAWKNALMLDKTYSSLREDLLNNNISGLQNTLQDFSKNISNYMTAVGDSIQQNTIEKIIAAKNEIDKFNGIQATINQNVVSEDQSKINQMIENSKQWATASSGSKEDLEKRTKLYEANQILGKSLGAVYKSSEGRWYKNGIPLYHSGGEIGTKTALGTLMDKILNKGETPLIGKQGELVVANPLSAMQNMIRNFTLPQIQPVMAGGQNGGSTFIFQIDKVIGTPDGAKSFASEAMKLLQKRGL